MSHDYESIKEEIRERLWTIADERDWSTLSPRDKALLYGHWVRDPDIGGVLAGFMDGRNVRVYIKDTLMKPYERIRMSAAEQRVLNKLGITGPVDIDARYIKPHGLGFADGRTVVWGRSRDWKFAVLALYERAMLNGQATGLVLIESGKTVGLSQRTLVEDVARRLGVSKVAWIPAS